MKLMHQEFKSCEIPFNGNVWFLLYSHWEMFAPFHFVVFLHSFLHVIGEVHLTLYKEKKTLNISTVFINYQQRVMAFYINYGSRPSKTLGSWVRGQVGNGNCAKKVREPCIASSPPQFHRVPFFFTSTLSPLSTIS